MRALPFWITSLVMSFVFMSAYGQSATFQRLEDKVYQYNNEARYEQSQALLLPLLDNPAYSPDEQFQAAVLLSYTYKRLLDYSTALTWLNKAHQLARQTTHPDSTRTQIQAQLAFVYFDIHQYAKSNRLMQQLEQSRFRYLDQESRAKIGQQQGYLLFLDRRYPDAEATYDRAILDLRASSPCDLPMILVKKMQLYAAMNQMERVEISLQQANRYADSCGIVKYRIYAYDELKGIYKTRRDMIRMAQTASIVDSLNNAYAQAQHIAGLHNQHQQLQQKKQERQLATRQQWLVYALAGMGILLLLTIGLLIALRLYRARQHRMEAELTRMRTELTAVLVPPPPSAQPQPSERIAGKPTYPPRPPQPDLSVLSDRQKDVLNGIIAGLSNRDIADKLHVSENTVKYHLKNIYVLLDVKDRVELLVNLSGR